MTAGSLTDPESTRHTMASDDPPCPGNACSSSSSARVDSVPGREKASVYCGTAAADPTPSPIASTSHSPRTTKRCVKHQRAIAATRQLLRIERRMRYVVVGVSTAEDLAKLCVCQAGLTRLSVCLDRWALVKAD
jgi:hypothetical protein